MIGRLKHSLLARGLLPVAVIISLLFAGGIGAVALLMLGAATAGLEELADLGVAQTAGAARDALWNLDNQGAAAALAGLSRSQDFAYGAVLDDQGKVFAEAGKRPATAKDLVVRRIDVIMTDNGTSKKIGTVEVGLSLTRRMTEITRSCVIMAGAGVVGLAAVLALMTVILKGVVGPIRGMTRVMGELSKGNLGVAIPAQNRSDELGAMAHAVQFFKDNLVRVKELEAQRIAKELAEDAERRRMILGIADKLEQEIGVVVEALESAVASMGSTAQEMADSAKVTSGEAQAVARASGQASTNVQTVAAATEELHASIGEISRRMAETTNITARAVDLATRADNEVQSLTLAAERIGSVVVLINEIAQKTNLLALRVFSP